METRVGPLRAMPFLFRRRLSVAALGCLLITVPWAVAQTEEAPRLHIAPLEGSTGATVSRLIAEDMELSEALPLTSTAAGAYVLKGSAVSGRIEGLLLDPAGEEVLQNVYDSPDLRRSAHQLADDIVFALTGRPGIATGRIAFVSTITGKKEVHVCETDGRSVRRVTYDGEVAAHPSISRDGGFLTYVGYATGYADVYFLDLLTGRRRRILSLPGTNTGAALSPDGRSLAVVLSHTGRPALYVTGTDGRIHRRLTKGNVLAASPAWSPDGSTLTFTADDGSGPQLRQVRASGGRLREISANFPDAFAADWSPDGRRLAFVTKLSGEAQIAIFDQGAERARILGPGRDPSWGADSLHLVYSTGDELVIANVDNGRRRTVVKNMGRVTEPCWTK